MGKPNLGLNSSIGFKAETASGEQIVLTTGASFLDILSAGLQYAATNYSEAPIVGTRMLGEAAEQFSHNDGKGKFSCRARNSYIAELLEMVLGVASGAGYTAIKDGTELPTYTFESSLAGANSIALIGCKANEMAFKSEAGQPLTIETDLVAMSGVRNPVVTSAVYTAWSDEKLFMHSSLSMTAASAAWLDTAALASIKTIELTLKNNLVDDDFTNSIDRQYISEGMFEAGLKLTVPYNAVTKGFWAAVAALTVACFTIVWSDGTNTLTAVVSARCTTELPEISEVDGQYLDLEFEARTTATDVNGVVMTLAVISAE